MTIDLDALEKRLRKAKDGQAYRSVRHRHDTFQVAEPDIDAAVTLIAELKALQAFAADEIAFAFCAGFNDAIDREKWDDCYDFAASKAGAYRNDRIRAFLARNGKGEGQ